MKKIIPILLSTVMMAGLMAAACGGDDAENPSTATDGSDAAEDPVTLRLGYFPNITHAQALVGLEQGAFEELLPENVTLQPIEFNAGPSVIEALFAGQVDISYIGPNPAITGFIRSNGEALRIISGATSGGALFIVRPDAGIAAPEDLANKRIATPQLGNTQDVALRAYLINNGLAARENGGNVQVIPIANPDILSLFQRGEIDGAWVPEPWASRLIEDAGGEVFLDERDIWPDERFVTAQVIVRTKFLEEHPDVVREFLRAHVQITQFIEENPEEAKALVNRAIEQAVGVPLPDAIIDRAWENIDITWDPVTASLQRSADHAYELEFLDDEPNLGGIYRLDLLNEVLAGEGLEEIR